MAQPVEGESLYSVLARTLAVFGPVVDARFSRVAFGGGSGKVGVDWASGVGALVHPWSPWTAERLVTAHTSFNYHAHWLPPDVADKSFRAMADVRPATAALRLPGSGAERHRKLNLCPECLDADVAALGVGCWRVHHQLPGVYKCADHDVILWASIVAIVGQSRFLACSPRLVGEGLRSPFDESTARRLSHASRAMLDEPFVPVPSSRIQGAFRARLGEAGWLTRYGRTKRRLPDALRARYGGECLATLGLRFGPFHQSHPIQATWGWASEPRGPAIWRLLVLDFLQVDPLAFLRECRDLDRHAQATVPPVRPARDPPSRDAGSIAA